MLMGDQSTFNDRHPANKAAAVQLFRYERTCIFPGNTKLHVYIPKPYFYPAGIVSTFWNYKTNQRPIQSRRLEQFPNCHHFFLPVETQALRVGREQL